MFSTCHFLEPWGPFFRGTCLSSVTRVSLPWSLWNSGKCKVGYLSACERWNTSSSVWKESHLVTDKTWQRFILSHCVFHMWPFKWVVLWKWHRPLQFRSAQCTVLCVPVVSRSIQCWPVCHLKTDEGVFWFVCFLGGRPGFWKIITKFLNNPQLSFSADFEVKEYGKSNIAPTAAIPSFFPNWRRLFLNSSVVSGVLVKLTPESTFLYEDGAELTVNIEAKCVKIFGYTDLNKKIQK